MVPNLQINYLFPKYGYKSGNMIADKESLTYFSSNNVSKQIKILVKCCLNMRGLDPAKLVITDMNGCIGGDTLQFASYFKYVNSVEISPKFYEMLAHNINCYNFGNKISTHEGNSVDFVANNYQNVVYCDPPWGGKDYKSQKNITLEMNGLPMHELLMNIFKKQEIILAILKLPKNYNFQELRSAVLEYDETILYEQHDLVKITVVMFYRYPNIFSKR